MFSMTKLIASVVTMFALVTLSATAADDVKPTDGGKGSAFKSKSYELKEKGETTVALSFEAGKEVTVTTSGDREATIHLLVKGTYFEAKDTSPGPNCLVKFTPVEDGKFMLTIKNNGSEASKAMLAVKVAE